MSILELKINKEENFESESPSNDPINSGSRQRTNFTVPEQIPN